MHVFFDKFGSPLSWAGIVTFLPWDHSAIKLFPQKSPILRLGEKLREILFLKNSNNMCSVKQQGWPQWFPTKGSDLYVAENFHWHFGDKVLGMSLTSELHKLQTWNAFGCLPLWCSWDTFQEFRKHLIFFGTLGIRDAFQRLGWQHLRNQLPANGLPHLINWSWIF